MSDPWEAQREALGAFIREQRKRANLSLRQLAELTSLSRRAPERRSAGGAARRVPQHGRPVLTRRPPSSAPRLIVR